MSDAAPPMIFSAMAAVMADCTSVAKRDRNESQRFLFRGIDAVLNAVGPILRKHEVIVVPDVETVTHEQVQTSTGKPVTSCRLLVTYRWYATDGSYLESRVAAEAFDSGDKATPKAMSVAFRTAILQALALPTDEVDPDSQTYEQARRPAATVAPDETQTVRMSRQPQVVASGHADGNAISQAQIGKMGAMMREHGITERAAALHYINTLLQGRATPVASRSDLSKTEASTVIDALSQESKK